MKTIQIQKRRRKTMNKKEVEGIEKVIKEYLKKNLRMESRVRYLDAYSQPENYLDVYLGEGKYQNKILHDNIPGYPGYHISKRGIRDNWAGTSTNIRLLY